MGKYGFYTNLNDLKVWFEDASRTNDTTEWILYHGHIMKSSGNAGARNADQRDAGLTIEQSWDILSSMIESQSQQGGSFTVYMPTNGRANGQRAFVTIGGGKSSATVAGIASPQEYIDKEISHFKEMFALRQEIEDMRAEMQAKQSPIEAIGQRLIDSGVAEQLIAGIAMKYISPNVQQPPNMGAAHSPGNVDEGGDDQQRIEWALAVIGSVFPDLPGAMQKLAAFVSENPDIAKNMLNQYQQSETQAVSADEFKKTISNE